MTIMAPSLFVLILLASATSFRMGQRGRFKLRMQAEYEVTSDSESHKKLTFKVAGKPMSFETGKIGRQASGAVVGTYGDSMVYSTACFDREATAVDFTPLRVDWFARFSAVGQTVGAFHRRDSRGDDNEILVARLIDRPLRPMIADGWQHETQVLSWVLSYDKVHALEPLSICTASAAMAVSAIPFTKPVAGVELGLDPSTGQILVNPTKLEKSNSTLHLVMAGTDEGILMIEGVGDFIPEAVMVEALEKGHGAIKEVCAAIEHLQQVTGKEKKRETLYNLPSGVVDAVDSRFGAELQAALSIGDKQKRGKAVSLVEQAIVKEYVDQNDQNGPSKSNPSAQGVGVETPVVPAAEAEEVPSGEEEALPAAPADASVADEDEASELPADLPVAAAGAEPSAATVEGPYGDALAVKKATKKVLVRRLRGMILESGRRSDGRGVREVRPISVETDLLPGAHGSALFTRGETQALATATLGSKAMEAKFETLDEMGSKRFYLQYRFPPSSVGEVGRVGGVNRREVGHGNLAERALERGLPSPTEFPYSVRTESLITESCGSSSMATVCAGSLAMMDAGVPLRSAVAGIAMGLILGETAEEEPVVLTDILGLEDALGTMDFKVAGSRDGISSFQLDIKSEGLTMAVLRNALEQAREGRLAILDTMDAHLPAARDLCEQVPKILTFSVPPPSIGKIIGPKGKTIQGLIETHELVNINLNDEGTVQVESYNSTRNAEVQTIIEAMVKEVKDGGKGGGRGGSDDKSKVPAGPPPEQGLVYKDCPIKGVHNFGVFVEIVPGHEGLVHISELDSKRLSSPEEAGYAVGQNLDVKVLGRNDKGQWRLSRKALLLRENDEKEKESKSIAQPPVAASSQKAEENWR